MKVFSVFDEKARKGVQGRAKSLSIVQQKLKGEKVIWMHAASLGEYEQGLPVLEKIKQKYPSYKVLVTFFSPSGYENVIKKQHIADAVCYLPFDKKSMIREFVSQFRTEIFFTVKYDFWYHLLRELKKQEAKIFVISALFYEKQVFFKPYGKWFVDRLKTDVDWFFHQTEESQKRVKKIGLMQSSVSGDTRFDRVKQIRRRDNKVPFIDEFKSESLLVVFGSSWEAEEKIAKMLAQEKPEFKIIIAPHDLHRVSSLKEMFPNAVLYSEVRESSVIEGTNLLIIDSIGILSRIYSYADVAIVGGGFHSSGLHNILEAATFGIPVIFGNQYKKNPEADSLIAHNGGKSFSKENEAIEYVLKLLKDQKMLYEMSQKAREFIDNQPNATELILKRLNQML